MVFPLTLFGFQSEVNRWKKILFIISINCLVFYFFVVIFHARGLGNMNNGDSNNLVAGASTAIECIRSQSFTGCGLLDGGHSSVFPYALLQYIPASLVILAGGSSEFTLHFLVWLNIGAVVMIYVVGSLSLRKSIGKVSLFLCLLLASSLNYQMTAAFSEPLAALVILCFVVALKNEKPLLTIIFGLLSSVSKETMFPVLFMLALGIVLQSGQKGESWRDLLRKMCPASVGIISGLVLNGLFNVFRFETWRNTMYLGEELRTEGLVRSAAYFVGQFISPSSGLLVFWPVWSSLLVVSVMAMSFRARGDGIEWGLLAVFIAIVTSSASLAVWYSPFGWLALGPRLMVPVLPATGFLMIEFLEDSRNLFKTKAKHLALKVTLAASTLASIVLVVPLTFSPWTWSRGVSALIQPSDDCIGFLNAPIQSEKAAYYACADEMMFRFTPSVVRQLVNPSWTMDGLGWLWGFVTMVVLLILASEYLLASTERDR